MAFADLASLGAGVELLQRSLARGRLGHAYLISGDQLDAPERLARTLAKTLNCQAPPRRGEGGVAADCCDRCLSCRKVDDDNHPDVRWVRPESKTRVITVDQMRSVMQSVMMKPSEQGWKVAILMAADRLNQQAANSFLKTLEEPPPRSTLILLSREPQKLLETILSRCLRLHVAEAGEGGTVKAHGDWLISFAALVTQTKAGTLERYRLLGQLLARLGEMKAQIEKVLTKKSPLETHDEIEPALKDRWEEELAAAIEAEYRRQRAELLEALQGWLRDVWLTSRRLPVPSPFQPTLAGATETVGSRITPRSAQLNLEVMEETQRLLGSNIQEALALEVGLLKLQL